MQSASRYGKLYAADAPGPGKPARKHGYYCTVSVSSRPQTVIVTIAFDSTKNVQD